MQHMKTALTITKLYDIRQNLNHELIVVLLLHDLIRHHVRQFLLFCKKNDRVDYPAPNSPLVKRTADIVKSPQIIGPLDILRGIIC